MPFTAMREYEGPAFHMACQQFDRVADYLELPQAVRERTKWPKRALVVAVPVRMDEGTVRVFPGYRVQHHLSLGPTKGGLRYHPDVTLGEVAALAMWMSWKCALAGLPYGGAKGGIACDPRRMSVGELERLTRRFTQELIPFIGGHVDVMAPDLGTNEQTMAWIMDTYAVQGGKETPEIVTGKPVGLGGSLGRKEATGRGVAFLADRAMSALDIDAAKATAVVQGFGNVGSHAARVLARHGAKIIGVGVYDGATCNANGINLDELETHLRANGHNIAGFKGGEPITNEQLLELKCDVLAPCALERAITEKNAARLQCRVLAEGANGPTTPEADRILEERGDVFLVPDILCNAGGVVVSYFEWVQNLQSFSWSEAEVNDKLYRILEQAFAAVIHRAKREGIPHRLAALAIGVERVADAKQQRGLFP